MFKTRLAIAAAFIFGAMAIPELAHAQIGGPGIGSALSNNAMEHQGMVHAGVDDIARHADQDSPEKTLKDVRHGMKDADPTVRVEELKKLRNIDKPEADLILIDALSDPDIRVRIKAIDLLGAREVNDAVEPISQMLFLRSTEPLVKLHATGALGRIGDSRGVLPVMQFLQEEQSTGGDERARGTAVFALGEIGNDQANGLLADEASDDSSETVRRLAREALQKIDGEIPTQHSKMLAMQKASAEEPTDEKLQKLREFDAKLQAMDR